MCVGRLSVTRSTTTTTTGHSTPRVTVDVSVKETKDAKRTAKGLKRKTRNLYKLKQVTKILNSFFNYAINSNIYLSTLTSFSFCPFFIKLFCFPSSNLAREWDAISTYYSGCSNLLATSAAEKKLRMAEMACKQRSSPSKTYGEAETGRGLMDV